MTPLQQAEKRIRELVPSLQELSFGCAVFADWRGKSVKHVVVWKEGGYIGIVENRWRGEKTPDKKTSKAVKEYDVSVRGHPIHLEHVLLAFEKVGKLNVCISSLGEFWELTSSENVKYLTYFKYNLSLPFNQQSEEFYQLINKVLE